MITSRIKVHGAVTIKEPTFYVTLCKNCLYIFHYIASGTRNFWIPLSLLGRRVGSLSAIQVKSEFTTGKSFGGEAKSLDCPLAVDAVKDVTLVSSLCKVRFWPKLKFM